MNEHRGSKVKPTANGFVIFTYVNKSFNYNFCIFLTFARTIIRK